VLPTLGDRPPLWWSDATSMWFTGSHELVSEIVRDERWLSDPTAASSFSVGDTAAARIADLITRAILWTDPPVHTGLRATIGPFFSARVTQALEAAMAARCDHLIEGAAGAGRSGEPVDVMASVCLPLPVGVIADLLGIHADDVSWLAAESRFLTWIGELEMPEPVRSRATVALVRVMRFFKKLVAQKEVEPGDDLTSLLVADRDAGRLADDGIIANLLLLLMAGHETTSSLIACGLVRLLAERDHLDRLQEDPSLWRPAIDEIVRLDGPVMLLTRVAAVAAQTSSCTVAAGDRVVCLIRVANRDPRTFDRPDEFVLDRSPNRHLGFGFGAHHCVGAALARMETRIVLSRLLERQPGLRVEDISWRPLTALRQPERLLVSGWR